MGGLPAGATLWGRAVFLGPEPVELTVAAGKTIEKLRGRFGGRRMAEYSWTYRRRVEVGRSGSAKRRLNILILTLVAALCAGHALAQERAIGREQAERSETAAIRGRVVDTAGKPLAGAQVVLTLDRGEEWKFTVTGDDGSYAFRELPAGRYTVSVTRSGFVTLQYGQRRPYARGTAIDLAAGQAASRVDVVLPRGSVIAGRVINEAGEPMPGVRIEALRRQFSAGRYRAVPVGTSRETDDRGSFRLYGLAPGRYLLAAGGSSLTGVETERASGPSRGYALTYYPGTSDVSAAHVVVVGLEEEIRDLTFVLRRVRLVSISGRVLPTSVSNVPAGQVHCRPAEDGEPDGPGAPLSPDGTFHMTGVAPGRYRCEAWVHAPPTSEFGTFPIEVDADDVEGLEITTAPKVPVYGQVVFDNPRQLAVPSQLTIIARMDPPGGGDRVATAGMEPDGTFVLELPAGVPHLITCHGLPSTWALRSIALGGADATDASITAGRDSGVLTLTVTSNVTAITGTAYDDRGPVRDYDVLIFPDRPPGASASASESRHRGTATADRQGSFELLGLPPGRYLALALDGIDFTMVDDPAYLDALRPRATPLSLSEGERKVLALKLVREP